MNWVFRSPRYRQARIAVNEARKKLEQEDQFLHERVVEWAADPQRFLLIPSDFKARITAEAAYKAAEQVLSRVLAEKYTDLLK